MNFASKVLKSFDLLSALAKTAASWLCEIQSWYVAIVSNERSFDHNPQV